jgi:Xaa-Pro aminopeptidase
MADDALLMVADSEHDANMLYAVGMFLPEPFVYLQHKGRPSIMVRELDLDRARRKARNCRVLSLARYQEALSRAGKKSPKLCDVIKALLKERKIKRVTVPAEFPHGLARQLRDRKVKVKVVKGRCFPQRELKTPEEVKKISAALIMAEVGLAEGIQVLKRSKVGKNGQLYHNNAVLTSERLRAVIDTAIVQSGGQVNQSIVACGAQACDPVENGYGPLRANEPIVLDVFPRSQKTGYFGDITRTVVKGRAREEVRKLYHTVARAQEIAFSMIKPGSEARSIHQAVADFFQEQGYQTGKTEGRMQGFFHPTGHGVGLELQEGPSLARNSSDCLRSGHVVTVEPGLYYPAIGAVRLEDMALVIANGAKNLTKFEKILEI